MGSQLQLCTTVGSQLFRKCTKFWLPLVWPLQPMLKLNQATWDMAMDMDTHWEVLALVLVSTLLGQSMSPDLSKVLVSAVLSQATLDMVLPLMDAIGGVSTGVGLHPTGAVYESRSAQGLGKRSADAEPGYYTQNYWPSVVTPYGYSTCYGCRGKRSAEPGYLGLGYGYGYGIGGVSRGVGLHPTGSVYESRSAQGIGKRSAEAEPGYYTQNYWPSVVTPYGYSTCYGCRGKRSAEPGY